MQIYTDGSGGTHSGDPRLRRCGWAWVINSANGEMGHAPVGYYGEYGSLGGRQTVPRAELTAVMNALLAVEQYGQRDNIVTIWSDSRIVVD
eukprot:915281-Karenia_brevis.AAC.1